jgi:hypothetical protein
VLIIPVAVAVAALSGAMGVAIWFGEPLASVGITLAFSLLFSLLCLAFVYFGLTALFDRATIEIGQGRLVVVEGPVPTRRRRELDVATVRQVYIIRRETRYSSFYKIYALVQSGPHVHLLTVDDPQLALYLEQAMERALGLDDRVVRGEWRPRPYLL